MWLTKNKIKIFRSLAHLLQVDSLNNDSEIKVSSFIITLLSKDK